MSYALGIQNKRDQVFFDRRYFLLNREEPVNERHRRDLIKSLYSELTTFCEDTITEKLGFVFNEKKVRMLLNENKE